MNALFKRTEKSIYGLPFYTWSDHWGEIICLLGEELSNLETSVINISPAEPYGLTYDVLGDVGFSPRLRGAVDEITELLVKLNPDQGIMMFEKILLDKFTTLSLHNLFSLLSRKLNNETGLANSQAFHSPINPETSDKGFPVHADLFKARAIFNIISRTDAFEGGDILLLPFKGLTDAMDSIDTMPLAVREYIKEALQTRMHTDAFDSIFNLIHGEYPWANDLNLEIASRQLCIPGKYGMGYFVIDGQWLHGRTKIHGPVVETRLQRLVFDTEHTMALPTASPVKAREEDCLYSHVNNNLIYKSQKSMIYKAQRQK